MKPAMKPVKITERNIMFTQPMGEGYDLNLGLILGNKYNYVIDTGLGSGSVAPVLEYTANDGKPVIAVNTHWHWDHIFGNFVFEKSFIIAHSACRELIEKNWDEIDRGCAKYKDGEMRKCLPNTVFEGEIRFPEDGVVIFHSPGHSADCISVYDAVDKVLHAGDNIGDTEEEIVPWIDTDMETFRKLIETYKRYDFDFCVSGHNKPQTKAVLARMEAGLAEAWGKQRQNTP
ncbi:MAG: MBL fold metallo-hydrolase [Defluviitaleaceae bacterium]|nr:MBL fold metallo-hydrolase [Defluviitaleaceae bacterium]MCL2835144.1 MBL fold metallo-hydrolase [Defluviitaleaceae bacterium]